MKSNESSSTSSKKSEHAVPETLDPRLLSVKKMTFEQLHSNLCKRLENRGHLNEIKANIRNKLVNELFDISSQHNLAKKVKASNQNSKLPEQVSHWLICDYLTREGYQFTLSTFLRESQLVTIPNERFTIEDILHILSIPKQSNLYKDLIELYKNSSERCLLYHIIHKLLSEIPFKVPKMDAQTNTNSASNDKVDNPTTNHIDEEMLRNRLDEVIQQRLKLAFKTVNEKKMNENHLEKSTKSEIVTPELHEQKKNNVDSSNLEIMEENQKIAERDKHIANLSEQNRNLQNQVNTLTEMLTAKSDYDIIKAELEIAKKELSATLKRFEECQINCFQLKNDFEKKISRLSLEIVTPTSELLKAREALLKTESDFLQKQEHSESQIKKLLEENKELKSQNGKAFSRINDLKHHIGSLNQLTERLQAEIQNLQWLQQEKERQQFRTRSFITQPLHLQNEYPSVTPFTSNFPYHYTSNVTNSRRPTHQSYSSSSGSSSHKPPSFIQEAKQRIDTLQAEAESLERKYGRCLETQLTRPLVSSCYPYQLHAQHKVASNSLPILNQTSLSSTRFSSTTDLVMDKEQQRNVRQSVLNKRDHHFTSESGDELLFLFQSKDRDSPKRQDASRSKSSDSHPVPDLEIEIARATNRSNILDETMPSYPYLNDSVLNGLPNVDVGNEGISSQKLQNEDLVKSNLDIGDQIDPNLVSGVHFSTPTSNPSFAPSNCSTPNAKPTFIPLSQRNLSTVYENKSNESNDGSISEKSLSIGNQKDENLNDTDFW